MIKIYHKISNIAINFIANHVLIFMFLWIGILSYLILRCNEDLKFLIAPSIAFFVPFLIMKFNKHKEEKQNEDFRKIINTSIFNCLSKMQNVYNDYLNYAHANNNISQQIKESDKFNNPKYDLSNNATFKSKINYIKDYTDREVDSIISSKLQFENFENFKLLVKYKEIIDKYNKIYFDSSINGNKFYKELYEILEINKDKIKEMII